MDVPQSLVAAFPPSDRLLVDVARREIDDDILLEIACADYGIDAGRHMEPLRNIRDTGIVPTRLAWHPGEVLELIRWSNPQDPEHKPGSTGRRGHLMRAFACAALLATGDDSAEEATLAHCLASAKELGDEMNEAAARFLTWRIPSKDESDRWLFVLGLLVVATRFPPSRVSDATLGEMAAWALEEENAERRMPAGWERPPAPFGVTYGYWTPLAKELSFRAETSQSPELRENLELIGALILDE